jgi:hypothetical protein
LHGIIVNQIIGVSFVVVLFNVTLARSEPPASTVQVIRIRNEEPVAKGSGLVDAISLGAYRPVS